ncbi:protein senC [Amylibacter marinus]|uniref:Protein senC n=1 Tax=Amylibacter marinus TaxID=1475483 RepID=A0ABQ5VX40_9RHOB|nr:SCO family protein [Amylibacter marinus]GLQ35621.1 protein senC [Amylibacter marinus]
MGKRLGVALAGVAAVAVLGTGYMVSWQSGLQACGSTVIAGEQASIGGPFELIDQYGKTRTSADVITGPTLIYFGYTFCPDICPLDTVRNLDAIDILDERGIDVLPVFITIDPARDTVSALADYAEVSHPRMLALTGSEAQVAAASKAYRTFYRKSGEGEDYLMDHSTFSYLMDETGFVEFFRRDASPAEVADAIGCFTEI